MSEIFQLRAYSLLTIITTQNTFFIDPKALFSENSSSFSLSVFTLFVASFD